MSSAAAIIRAAMYAVLMLVGFPMLVWGGLYIYSGIHITTAAIYGVAIFLSSIAVGIIAYGVLVVFEIRTFLHEKSLVVEQLAGLSEDNFIYYDEMIFQYHQGLVSSNNVLIAKLEKKRKDIVQNMEAMEQTMTADELDGFKSRNHFVEYMLSLNMDGAEPIPGKNVLIVFRINRLYEVNLEQGRVRGNALVDGFSTLLRKDSVRLPSDSFFLTRLYGADLGMVAMGVTEENVLAWLHEFEAALRAFHASGGSDYYPVAFMGVTYFESTEFATEVLARGDDAVRAVPNTPGASFKIYDDKALVNRQMSERRELLKRMLQPGQVQMQLLPVIGREGVPLYYQAGMLLTLPDGSKTEAIDLVQSAASLSQSMGFDLRCLADAIGEANSLEEPVAVRLNIQNLKRPVFVERMEGLLAPRSAAGDKGSTLVLMVSESTLENKELDFFALYNRLKKYRIKFGINDLQTQLQYAHQFVEMGFMLAELTTAYIEALPNSAQTQHSLSLLRELINNPDFYLIASGNSAFSVLDEPWATALNGYSLGTDS